MQGFFPPEKQSIKAKLLHDAVSVDKWLTLSMKHPCVGSDCIWQMCSVE